MATKERPKPFFFPQLCKACGRCIDACPKHCIEFSDEIEPVTGLRPVRLTLEDCNGCGLCFAACPEPYGLMPADGAHELRDPAEFFGQEPRVRELPDDIPDARIELPSGIHLVLKGTHASALGAVLGGCRHFFGYPITPSTEGAEYMAKMLPKLGGTYFQAVSEVATINLMYGCGGAGKRCMTYTSSPGFSLMLEGISYMIGAWIPGVIVNVMRGGPGLGNIAPEQSDIKLMCRGLGHGNTHAVVLAPSSPQEMLDLTFRAFEIAFRYRQPVVVAADGYLGQMTGRVTLPAHAVRPGLPGWAVSGDGEHRGNLHTTLFLSEVDLAERNERLNNMYTEMAAREQDAELYECSDADWLIIACNTPARMAKGAVRELRQRGIKVGLFRPITLWPFPIKRLAPLVNRLKGFVMVEGSNGQLEDEVRLALSHAGLHPPTVHRLRRLGGIMPEQREIVEVVSQLGEE